MRILVRIYINSNVRNKGKSSTHDEGRSLLLAEDLDAFLNRLLGFFASCNFGAAEDQLRNQTPFAGEVPLLGNLLINKRVVVLQVGTKAEGLKTSPDWASFVS